ncbi:hypothetical protein AgCh_020883 [Apium graveolens]
MKNETKGKFPSPHSPYFEINEDALPFGAALHASLAATYLLDIQSGTPVVKDDDHHNNCKKYVENLIQSTPYN